MKKSVFLIIGFLVLCQASFAGDNPSFSAVSPSGHTLYYWFTGSNTVKVSGKSDTSNYNASVQGTLTIPSTVTYSGRTYAVVRIANNAFRVSPGLTSVTIPNAVTSIGREAFSYCTGLTSVTIGNSVTSIDAQAFSYCTGLTSVVFNADSCTQAGGRYMIGNDRRVFAGCQSINSFVFGNNVKVIPAYLCIDIRSLTSVTIPNSITSIGLMAFSGCTGLTGSLTIPNSVTSIGGGAFLNCTGLTSVTIPSSVTSLLDSTFKNCTGLTGSLTIPNSVTSIGCGAFLNCTGLSGSLTIPNSVTSIDNGAFAGCTGLTSVTIGNSVTSIGGLAFDNCTGLTSVVFNAARCSHAGSHHFSSVFRGCSNINSFVFGNNVRIIPPYLCCFLYGLTSVTIGNSVTSIGEEAFYVDTSITSITSLATVAPTVDIDAFGYVPIIDAHIPCGSRMSYQSSYWSQLFHFIEDSRFTFSAASADETMGHVNVTTVPTCQSPTAVISASAAGGFYFDHWSTGSTANPDTIHLVSDSTVTAYFLPGYTLTVNVNDESMGSVTFPNGNTADYLDTIMAVAIPTAHHHVLNWQGQGIVATSVNKDTVWVRMTTNRTLRCIFAINSYNTVDVSVNDSTMGTATVNGAASVTVTSGETVTLAATANEGYHFVRWNDNNTEATRTVTVTADISFTAFFESDVPEGIDGVKTTDAKIYARDGQIVVEGSDGELVSLYDPAGRLLAVRREVVHGSPLQFDIPASGAYLVRIGNCTARKVVVIR